MTKALPPLTWFRAFEAAARHLSFTRAADELGVTQSAISQHVRALEGRLESPLFVRTKRTLHLTDAGRLLLPDVTAAIGQLDHATQRFLPAVSKPRLTVATSASIAQWLIAPALRAFQQAHPQIAIQLVTTIWPDDFSTTTADIEIRFGAQSVAGHDAHLLEPSYLMAVAAPEVAQAVAADKGLAGLHDVPLIQPVGISRSWAAMAKEAKLSKLLEPATLVDTHGLAVDLAVAGAGVALTHAQVAMPAVKRGLLQILPLGPWPADEGYYLAARTSSHPDAQKTFINWFQGLSQTFHASDEGPSPLS